MPSTDLHRRRQPSGQHPYRQLPSPRPARGKQRHGSHPHSIPPPSIPLNPTGPLPSDQTMKNASTDLTPLPQAHHSPTQDRRLSREWDASKVPPSQFQRPKGSIYATPSTRDGHVGGADRDQRYWDKLKEKVSRCGGLGAE
jgi:hypothetical protein